MRNIILALISLLMLSACNDKSVTYITGPTNPVFGPTNPVVIPTPATSPSPSPSGN